MTGNGRLGQVSEMGVWLRGFKPYISMRSAPSFLDGYLFYLERETLPSLSLFIENLHRITEIHISHRFLLRYAGFMVSHEIPAHRRGVSEILKFYPPTPPLQKIN